MAWLTGVPMGVVMGQQAGDRPPALVWDKVKGECPAGPDWPSLRGKVVAVSFGGDPIFPNEFTEWVEVIRGFQGQPVVFIQVAGGSEFILDRALATAPNGGCILFDSHGANRRNFKLPAMLPRTVVVDELGLIAGYSRGGPDADAIRSVLDHEEETGLFAVPPQLQPYDPTAGMDPSPSFEVHISPAPKDEMRALVDGPDRFIVKNQPLNPIVSVVWDTPPARISFPEKMDDGRYDIAAHIPAPDRGLLLEIVRKAVEEHFGLRVERETRMQHGYSLTAAQTRSPHLQAAREDGVWMVGRGQRSIIGTAQTMQEIARHLEGLLNAPVIDEAGLKGKYDYSASSDLPDAEAAFELADQLGLKLVPADRPIEVLVVRKVD
jgi:uncharacterized protein (TIGR03435 family)